MKIVLLGAAGFLGRAVSVELARRPEVGELILVDYVIRDAKRQAKLLSPKCRCAMADVGKPLELTRLLQGVDGVVNAVGPCAEYEKTALMACASMGVAVASIGNNTLSPADRGEVHAAFRAAGTAAVSGCGMMPGWTELLAAHFLGDPGTARAKSPPAERTRYLFFSPDRFGGYAFLREIAKTVGSETPSPPGAPAGRYFSLPDGSAIGVPEKNAGVRLARISNTVGRLGVVGKEFVATLLLWLRGSLTGPPGMPAAACGVSDRDRTARVEDPGGKLAAVLLAETVLRLASRSRKATGLLPIQELIGRKEAEAIAAAAGARIVKGTA